MNFLKVTFFGLLVVFVGCTQKEKTVSQPTSLTITKIEVIRYPEFNFSGTSWDPSDGPDLSIQIAKDNNIVWTSLTFIENPIYGNIQTFSMQPPYSFNSPRENYSISLFDVDSPTEKEFMGGLTFTPYDGTENKPEIINLDTGGSVAFRVHVTYNY